MSILTRLSACLAVALVCCASAASAAPAPAEYTSSRLRVVATDARIGFGLASAVAVLHTMASEPALALTRPAQSAPPLRRRVGPPGSPPRAATLFPLILRGQLYVVSSTGGPLLRLRTEGVLIGPPQLSPDGRQIAYVATARRFLDPYGNATATDVWVVPVPGQGANAPAHQITTTEPHVLRGQISWAPDSQHLAFNEGWHVVVADAATGARHAVLQVAPGPAFTSPLAWSPDGRQIVLAQPLPGHGPGYPTTLSLLTGAAAGSPARTITVRFPPGALGHPVPPGSYPDESVDWLPDGRGFVVQTLAKGEGPPTPTGLWIVSVSGGVARLMVGTRVGVSGETYPAGSPLAQPTRAIFSPDRTKLASDPANRLWIADAGGQRGYFLSLGLARGCVLTQLTWLAKASGLTYATACAVAGTTPPQVRVALFSIDARRGARPRLLYTSTGTDQPRLLIAPVTRCVLCGY